MRKDRQKVARQLGLTNMHDDEITVMISTVSEVNNTTDSAKILSEVRLVNHLLGLQRAKGIIRGFSGKRRGKRSGDTVHFQDMLMDEVMNWEKEQQPVASKPKGVPGTFTFLLDGSANANPTTVPVEELHATAKIYGFSKSQVDKIVKKPVGFSLRKGEWSMVKF